MNSVETKFINWIKVYGIWAARIGMAIIYLWFGGLKLFNLSPAEDFVKQAIPPFQNNLLYFILVLWEMGLGLGFLFPKLTRIVFPLFILHMLGTFLPLVIAITLTFTQFPYALTFEGQYIVKNLTLIVTGTMIWYTYISKEKKSS